MEIKTLIAISMLALLIAHCDVEGGRSSSRGSSSRSSSSKSSSSSGGWFGSRPSSSSSYSRPSPSPSYSSPSYSSPSYSSPSYKPASSPSSSYGWNLSPSSGKLLVFDSFNTVCTFKAVIPIFFGYFYSFSAVD